jgi:TfoX/Sxy family transcriptional regulator of competence genes
VNAYDSLVDELTADPTVSAAKMMGMPSLKVGSKMFGGSFDGNLVVKLGRERADELIAAGEATPFDPSGRNRPMKDWAQLGEGQGDWLALAEEAKAFVASGAG